MWKRIQNFRVWMMNPPESQEGMSVFERTTITSKNTYDKWLMSYLNLGAVPGDAAVGSGKSSSGGGGGTGKPPLSGGAPIPAGEKSKRGSLESMRRQSAIGTGSGITPQRSGVRFGGTTTIPPTSTPPGAPPVGGGQQQVIVTQPQRYSKAAEFDKGGRRSVSDYATFSNREGWSKWRRSVLGTAFDHKCENVLSETYVPDPSDPEECELFDRQRRFLYAVFTKVVTEPTAVEIVRRYSDVSKSNFGDAQAIFTELCDHFEGGALASVTASSLETQLTLTRLNKGWNKTVTAFVNKVEKMIQDHRDLTNGVHGDTYYIEKLNATFEEHKDMSDFIQSLESQAKLIERRVGSTLKAQTYESQLFEVKEMATTLDHRYSKQQSTRRANEASSKTASNSNSDRRGGRGNGGRGRGGRGSGGGRGNGGSSRKDNRAGPAYVPPDKWAGMSPEERDRIRAAREKARERQSNNSQRSETTTQETNSQDANSATTQQSSSTAPGSMVRDMMSSASNRASTATSEVIVNGVRYTRNANVSYRMSKHEKKAQVEGSLMDGGANGGLIGSDAGVL
jgi:hypothetical protein